MRNIQEILEIFAASQKMDFTPELLQIQSVLNYANEYVKPLGKIQFRGGNEPYITEIVARVLNALKSLGFVNTETFKPLPEYSNEFRRITLFLVLNTEATFKYDLTKDSTCAHLLNAIPQLPKCLLLSFIWGLSLDEFFYEIIAYSPIWFPLQFIDNAVDSLKFAEPYEVLERVDNLVCSIYTNIARSDYRQMSAVDKKIILGKYHDITMDLLRHFFSPDAEKFENWTKNKYYKYSGFVMKHILKMVLCCLQMFQKRPALAVDESLQVFQLAQELDPLVDTHDTEDNYSAVVVENLHKLNTTLLNSLQHNVMQVNCHAFMYWCEVDLDEETTLQRAVGEAAFQVRDLINVNECFEHNVGSQLETISIKPITIEQRINQSTIGEILEKFEKLSRDDEHLSKWIDCFIGRGELVLGNQECLETLETFTEVLTLENIKSMIAFGTQLNDEQQVEEKLITICLNAMDHFAVDDIVTLIAFAVERQEQHFGGLQLEGFDRQLIGVFNRAIFAQTPNEYLKVLIQNPTLFYDKVFDEVLVNDRQQRHMLEIIKATETVSRTFLATNLCKFFQKNVIESDSQHQLIPLFMAELFQLNIIPMEEFVIELLYKKYLVTALQAKEMRRIAVIMKTLAIIASKHKFEKLTPPLLVMGAQVLNDCRWDVMSYTEDAEIVVRNAIEFINNVMKKYLPEAIEQDKVWILRIIAPYKPMTRFYFQKLQLAKTDAPKPFDVFLHPDDFKLNEIKTIKFLLETVIRSTIKEMLWLARNTVLLPCFWGVMGMLTSIVAKSNVENALNCFRHCVNGFVRIFETNLLPQAETVDSKIELLEKTLKFISTLKGLPLYSDLFLSLNSHLLNIAEESVSEKIRLATDIKPIVEQLDDCEAKKMFVKKFDELLK